MKPFVKWVGGKTQLLSRLQPLVPNHFGCYFEPFLGGGALFLKIKPKKAVLSDINQVLVNTWKTIKNKPNTLIKELEHLQFKYQNSKDQKTLFVLARKIFNFLKDRDTALVSALFIFLNKTGFNGLYRVNSNDGFNVPWNKNPRATLFEKENIKSVSVFLKSNATTFVCKDFNHILSKVKENDFVYLDPPYDLLTKTSFTGYQKNKFLVNEQEKLVTLFQELDKKGCFVMLSNHKTPRIEKLYAKYHILSVNAKRMINCKGEKRGIIQELIITNYETDHFTRCLLPTKIIKVNQMGYSSNETN